MTELESRISDLKYIVYDSKNFYTIDWLDIETTQLAELFRKFFLNNNNIYLDLVFICLISMDFMSERLDCSSCPITEDWFEEFENYIIKKANNYEK